MGGEEGRRKKGVWRFGKGGGSAGGSVRGEEAQRRKTKKAINPKGTLKAKTLP